MAAGFFFCARETSCKKQGKHQVDKGDGSTLPIA